MPRSQPVDGFSLAYDRHGGGPPVLLLHGWPGERADWRAVVPLLDTEADVIVPDLRGFGDSDKHAEPPEEAYDARAQARSALGLLDELGVREVVVAGYDVGSRVAQAMVRERPEIFSALVVAPPLPGAGERVLAPEQVPEWWYQSFHRLDLAEKLIDGNREAARAYLHHFWSHRSGPDWEPADADLDRLADVYGAPGAFMASIAWYRAGAGTMMAASREKTPDPERRTAVPTTVLWPEHDPLFPVEWSDRLSEFFTDVSLQRLPDSGHFSPLEAPEEFAGAVRAALS